MEVKVIMNGFARRRHVEGSGLSHFTCEEVEVVWATSLWFAMNLISPGYREGVVLVNVPEEDLTHFVSSVCEITEDTPVVASYMPRRKGEPCQKVFRAGPKATPLPAKSCQPVLYRNDVLAEGDDNDSKLEDGVCWEIVSINVSPTEGELPMAPSALIRNHLGLPGGTRTIMTDEQFVETLRVSTAFWSNHAMQQPTIEWLLENPTS